MFKVYRILAGVFGVLLSLQSCLVYANEANPVPTARRGAVLVVPRRPTLVQVGFDMVYLRPVVMVCYEAGPGVDIPALNVWDAKARAWRRMSLEHFQSGSFLTFTPKKAIVVGTEAELPESIAGGTTWAGETVRISNLSIDNVFNVLGETVNLSGPEWKWLAKRYGLRIRDLNAERRRWGKYGPPGGRSERRPIRVPPEARISPRPMVIDEEPLAPAVPEDDGLPRSLSRPQPME